MGDQSVCLLSYLLLFFQHFSSYLGSSSRYSRGRHLCFLCISLTSTETIHDKATSLRDVDLLSIIELLPV